jgi:peptide-methionine (S)-S-oxide reductase
MTDEAETHQAAPDRPPAPDTRTAVLGGGCFWCLEAVFQRIEGVEEVTSGYAGGHEPEPTYRQVCTGTTGHAEVVRIRFDPEELPYDEVLRIFFTIHDPTTVNRQGGDVGTQYRSAIFHHSPDQLAIAKEVIRELEAEGLWDDPIVTEVTPFTTFHSAESYHQDYFNRNPYQPYCAAVIAPKVAKFRSKYLEKLAR